MEREEWWCMQLQRGMGGWYVVMEHICILIVVTQVSTCDTIAENYNCHTPTPQYTHTQMSACEPGEISVRSVDCTDINFLVLLLHHSYARCYCWGKLGEGYMEPPCTFFSISYKSIIISKNLKILKTMCIYVHI